MSGTLRTGTPPALAIEWDLHPPAWVLEAVRTGASSAGWDWKPRNVMHVWPDWPGTGEPPPTTCLITTGDSEWHHHLADIGAWDVKVIAIARRPPGGNSIHEGVSSALGLLDPIVVGLSDARRDTYIEIIERGIFRWLRAGSRNHMNSVDLREEIERFCGWVERNLTMNGSLEFFLEDIEGGPGRADRDLKQQLVRTRAALDQAGRLVEALRAELLKSYPTAETTTVVARALGLSGGVAAGFAMGVLATMTVAGVTGVGGALVVGAGGNALYDALKASLESVRAESSARSEGIVAAVESDENA